MNNDPTPPNPDPDDPGERRWPAIIAVLAMAGLYTALPASLSVGPRWLGATVICALLVPTVITHHRGQHSQNQIFGQIIAAVMTLFMVWSLVLLVVALPAHKEAPVVMLRSAVALWITNILVFALWYWRLDGGGPHARLLNPGVRGRAFLFPQMTMAHGGEDWSPIFVDYLFLAFNTSTAFSPTDAPILSRWAKVLTMIQAGISLSVVVFLAARAVNIL
jgi:hypothetical protein